MLPNLIVAGAGKSGTSSLHLYLDTHPDIAMTSMKEPHFFSDSRNYEFGPAFYDDLFDLSASAARYRGESSTGYMIFPGVPKRIHDSIPECRLIFLLRNPIDRAFSHYRWLVGLGLETRDFRSAFEADRHETPNPANGRAGAYGYIYQEGCYGTNLDRFASRFAPDQVLLLLAEELRSEPQACLDRCSRFLEIKQFPTVTPISANQSETLRYPRLRARVEGRGATQRVGGGRTRALLKRVLGEQAASRLRSAAVAALGTRSLDVPINVERSWLADLYAAEVASVRSRDSSFVTAWRTDFPV